MTRRCLEPRWVLVLASLAIIATAPSIGAQGREDQSREWRTRFRSSVDAVALDVCVRGHDGRLVPDLSPDDFLVVENGIVQEIAYFSPEGAIPLAVQLLIDSSQSMGSRLLERATDAAAEFIGTLGPDDRVEILSFDDRSDVRYASSTDHDGARRGLRGLEANGPTTRLYESVVVGLRRFSATDRPGGPAYRHVMIVLSDGEDTGSRPSFDDVVADVRRSNVLVYVLSLREGVGRRRVPPVWQMLQLAHDSGGRTFAVSDAASLTEAYREIGQELRQSYRLGYVPRASSTAADWRAIVVRVPRRAALARTRPGYYASPRSVPGARPR